MGRFSISRLPMLLALACFAPAAAHSSPPQTYSPNKNATGSARVLRPLTLLKTADMDFATVAVTTGGTATIDPYTGQMSLSGGLVQVGGNPSPARYLGAGSLFTIVVIQLPTQPVQIRRFGGTETLTVSNFTLDGSPYKLLIGYPGFTFAVGAQLTVPAGTLDGVYVGNINVTVDYY